MSPREAILEAAAALRGAGVEDPRTDASWLLAHVTGRPALALRTDADSALPEEALRRYRALWQRRCERIPLQYLTREQPFMGHSFHVDEHVLIPRPETELMTERAIDRLRAFGLRGARVLDLCCGSGCIGVSVALALSGLAPEVHLSDLSPEALAVARRNAEALGAAVALHRGDLFDAVPGLTFELIVSNPPYIPSEDCRALQPEVLREPRLALDGGPDGLDLYRRIVRDAPARLAPGGILLMELGAGEADAVAALMRSAGFRDIAVSPDLAGIPRIIEGHLA